MYPAQSLKTSLPEQAERLDVIARPTGTLPCYSVSLSGNSKIDLKPIPSKLPIRQKQIHRTVFSGKSSVLNLTNMSVTDADLDHLFGLLTMISQIFRRRCRPV